MHPVQIHILDDRASERHRRVHGQDSGILGTLAAQRKDIMIGVVLIAVLTALHIAIMYLALLEGE